MLGTCKISVMLHLGSSDTVFMVLFKEILIPDTKDKMLVQFLLCSQCLLPCSSFQLFDLLSFLKDHVVGHVQYLKSIEWWCAGTTELNTDIIEKPLFFYN